MNTFPETLIITDSAAASDGGSLVLVSISPEQKEYSFHLNWSTAAQTQGTTQLYVNGAAIPKGSTEESGWLDLLTSAEVRYNDSDAPDKDYSEAVRGTLNHLISLVQSDIYQKGKGKVG